jgi:hypothetical protein
VRRLLLTLLALHFLFIAFVPFRETLWLIEHRSTIVTQPAETFASKVDRLLAAGLAGVSGRIHPVSEVAVTYLHLAGIEAGYGYFAPNVPDSYKLRFEGRSSDEVNFHPIVVSHGRDELRTSSLLDYLGREASGPVREFILKLLAYSVWKTHPEVSRMRVTLESLHQPSVAEFGRGQIAFYELVVAYDFSLTRPMVSPSTP